MCQMKLNRKQITISLECCHSTNIADCRNCAYRDKETEFGCTNLLVKDALSLIRELIEENEKLRAENAEQDQSIINALMRMGEIRRETKIHTTQEMQKLFEERLDISVCGYSTEEVRLDCFDTLERIAIEILEGDEI